MNKLSLLVIFSFAVLKGSIAFSDTNYFTKFTGKYFASSGIHSDNKGGNNQCTWLQSNNFSGIEITDKNLIFKRRGAQDEIIKLIPKNDSDSNRGTIPGVGGCSEYNSGSTFSARHVHKCEFMLDDVFSELYQIDQLKNDYLLTIQIINNRVSKEETDCLYSVRISK